MQSLNRQSNEDLKYQLTRRIVEHVKETQIELLEDPYDVRANTRWVRTMLSGIETSNEMGEDVGFTPFYSGPYTFDKDNLMDEIKRTSSIFINTLMLLNIFHENMDRDFENLRNGTISDFSSHPSTRNLKVSEIKSMMDQQKIKNKKRRMHWEGHLENLLDMVENFEEERDSDVEEWQEEDQESDSEL